MCSRRPAPFNLFWLRSLAHAGAAAVLVDEFNGGFFKCSSDFISGCLPAVKPKPAAAYERRRLQHQAFTFSRSTFGILRKTDQDQNLKYDYSATFELG